VQEEVIVINQTKVCTTCKQDKPLTEYRSRGGKLSHLLKSPCNTCLYKSHREWVEKNPDKVSTYREKDSWTLAKRVARHNLTPEEFINKYNEQNKCCGICKSEIDLVNSAIDHNHNTESFRGVLCKQCNRALGMFKDDKVILSNAIEYLTKNGSYAMEDTKTKWLKLNHSSR